MKGSDPKTYDEEIQRILADQSIQKVKLAVTDIDGVMRGKFIHKDKFRSALEGGFGFCDVIFGWDCGDVCYDNAAYTGWHSGYPDAHARIDVNTVRRVPWDGDMPFFLADFVQGDGAPLPVCPRQALKRVVAKAESMGLGAAFALEFEWFNFRETSETLDAKGYAQPTPLTPGMFGYSLLRAGQNRAYFHALMDEMAAFGVPLEGLHTETGPGVYEAAILYDRSPLEAADRAVLFKSGVKDVAHRFGIMPTFMAKWDETLPGCSGHMHQSVYDLSTGTNLFHDAARPHRMSELFEHYLAGQLALMPELLAFYAPNVNSYKRLVEGMWAPTRATWGVDNRTSSLRVIPGTEKSTRLETRVSGSDVNPYLSVAAALGSGLYGIEHRLTLEQAAVQGSAYAAKEGQRLSRTLQESTQALAASEVAREIFGAGLVDHFVSTREWEWRQFQKAVTSWELRRYFEIL